MQLGPSCVSVTVHVHALACVCVPVWVFLAQCCSREHTTLYAKDSEQRKQREKGTRENWVEALEVED